MERPTTPRSRFASDLLARMRQALGRDAVRATAQTPYHVTRRRLVVINLAVVSAILLVMASTIYIVETHALQQQVEQQLSSRADSELASGADLIASHQTQPPTVHLPDSSEHDSGSEKYEPSGPNIFSVVLDTHGMIIGDPSGVSTYGLPDLKAAAPVLSGASRGEFVNAHVQDQEYMLLTRPLYSKGALVGVVQVGQSLAPMEQQTHDLLVTLFLVGVGALTLTAGASLYLADRALLPMRLAYDRQRQFAAAASHELRTPLAFVRSQLELVNRRMQRAQAGVSGSFAAPGALAETVREDIDDTVNEVDYMTRLVRDLLLMARDEGDHRSIAWRPVELRALAQDVADTVRPSATQRGLILDDRTTSDEPIWVMGDHDRLRQLLLILLDNATRYTASGGHVWLEARSGRGSLLGGRRPIAQIIVGDTGVGIAHDQQERIFEAFYRPSGHSANTSASNDNHSGAGLGLALARWLVSAHSGDIAVKSAPGDGSVFTVSLPLHAEPRTDGAGSAVTGDQAGDGTNDTAAIKPAAEAERSDAGATAES
ncbi:MAG TPA: HAMP domain-containing sensor histidine kinase [Ktedonobacterales bacterium]|nr:HAMP domain-containing sensor histidine kinase [Ktedonobacterales bacterium]